MTVTLDTDPPPLKAVFVEGTLRLAPRPTQLTVGWMMVHGLFEAGTAKAPFQHSFVLTLTGQDPTANVSCSGMAMGSKFLSVMNGGRISLHSPAGTSWTKLRRDCAPGEVQILVDQAVNWQVGDTLVIAPRVARPGQTERRVIKSISGTTITLDQALGFPHSGTAPTVDETTLEMRGEVARLNRKIVIQGDAASTALNYGGHVMVMAGGSAKLNGVEFVRMGQLNQLGRYPFHWHLVGDAPGQYLRNCVVNSSFQRGFVIHGTRKVLLENNVVYDSGGHNYSIEDASSTDNVLQNNLALENRVLVLKERTLAGQRDNQAANFWIRAARNTIVGNAAAASMANGFWYDGVTDGPTVFHSNVAHSSYARSVRNDFVRDAGLLVENLGTGRLEFSDSLFYQNVNGVWPTESGAQTYRGLAFADHWVSSPVTMDVTGENTVFESPLFVGRTRPSSKGENPLSAGLPPAVLIQYSGAAELKDPVFAKYGNNILLSSNDIFVEWQAQFFLSNSRLIETSPSSRNLHDSAITTLLDTSYGLGIGTYSPSFHPQLSGTSAELVSLGDSGDYLRGTKREGYGLLRTEVPGGDYFSLPWHEPSFHAVRSDGLRFADEEINGFRLICGGEYRYALEQAPAESTFFITLDNQGFITPGVAQNVEISLPLATAPRSVARIDEVNEDTIPAAISSRLSASPSKADFLINPSSRYFYDAAAGKLYLQADARWLVIAR